MNARSFILILCPAACLSISLAADIQGRVLMSGIFKISKEVESVKSPQTPSGLTSVPANTPILISQTNRIPARLGIRFGFWYEITNLSVKDGELVELVKVVRHPPITKPDGTVSKSFEFTETPPVSDGRAKGWTGYGFDQRYELAIGTWEFEMKYKGTTVCKCTFDVVKD